MIEIVSHCYAKTHPQYSVFLRAQLSSIVTSLKETKVCVSICCCPNDKNTVKVLDEFQEILGEKLHRINLAEILLFRRSIGRNIVAKQTEADLVWFSDVDHVFGSGCLLSLQEIWNKKTFETSKEISLMWPETIQIHKDHLIGDVFWKSNENAKGLISINPDDFVPKHYTKSIGGVQIVSGWYARSHGYLDRHEKWQRPVSGDKPFPDFRDDVKFRGVCATDGVVEKIQLPNLFRLRHSETTYK